MSDEEQELTSRLPSPRKARLLDIQPGVVFSRPGDDGHLKRPSLVIATQRIDGDRVQFVQVMDLETGEESGTWHQLLTQHEFLVYDVTLEHHRYTNASSETQTVRLGRRVEAIHPREVFHYTGVARPDLFSEDVWTYSREPVDVRIDPPDSDD